jgi:surfactin synthase thioesterase subunit
MWEGGHMFLLDHVAEVAEFVVGCHQRSITRPLQSIEG